jgi:hypothetical protein
MDRNDIRADKVDINNGLIYTGSQFFLRKDFGARQNTVDRFAKTIFSVRQQICLKHNARFIVAPRYAKHEKSNKKAWRETPSIEKKPIFFEAICIVTAHPLSARIEPPYMQGMVKRV